MREVIILGLGPTRDECPYDKETWGVNTCYEFAPRLDKLFIMDRINEEELDLESLRKLPCIVASRFYPGFSNLEVYPIGQVLTLFNTHFFSNSICYMIAYALLKGYERIWLYGIDMMANSSYVTEKGGVEYWMGIAQALRVPIINTARSATGKTIDGKMYGDWDFGQEELPEELAQEVRDLISKIPGLRDLSAEWVQGLDGDWVRLPQKVVHI